MMMTKVKAKWFEKPVEQFMGSLIDYAGLFPPAALPLSEAILHYRDYINGADGWMLRSFVIPAAKLNELTAFHSYFSEQRPLQLSVILTKDGSIEHDMEEMQNFLQTFQHNGAITAIEIPLPSHADVSFLESVLNKFEDYSLYFEVGSTNGQLEQTLNMLQAMKEKKMKHIGVKIRMGGVTANFIPSSKQAAMMISECRKRKLPIKFTAGLHHPIRQYRSEVAANMHGFVNVFAASIFAYCRAIDAEVIEAVLEDENPASFSFTSSTLSWKHITVCAEEIQQARRCFSSSYGSCSFDEPREELGELMIFNGEAAK